jgi:hypothetical protein
MSDKQNNNLLNMANAYVFWAKACKSNKVEYISKVKTAKKICKQIQAIHLIDKTLLMELTVTMISMRKAS